VQVSNRRVGDYDHLGVSSFKLDLDAIADTLESANYGVHQMLSAMVRAHRRQIESGRKKAWPDDIMFKVEELLNKGYF